MTKNIASPPAARAGGFSLLEVLIAVLVLSFGLLGLAVMQLKMLQSAHSGYQRTLASTIAADAVERLWIARAGVQTADELVVATIEAAWLQAWSPNADGDTLSLPSLSTASGITADTASEGRFTVVIDWEESRFENANEAASRFEYNAEML